jgi:20S proteasome alpha/beta subunit
MNKEIGFATAITGLAAGTLFMVSYARVQAELQDKFGECSVIIKLADAASVVR